ncbi:MULTISPECIES: hypothetical protein [Halorubrum]|uniref:DUF8107 domain-containing protein n=1 Tax=Halorubrum sodomense TaxID=35743 RepID=A0A1I6FJZ1_HALSD|nr:MULTISPECIES: hypothetical protein [Halorubrum]TKX54061.1 hypothetical protein EXE42_09935 [Halorubrum sp. SP3]SFR30250.1 hypothetical protein SAMN04487937_0067 [Halorubrum sodomense]
MSAEGSGEESGEGDGPGVREGVERSSGDPKVLLAMNAVLSTWFAWMVVWGLDFLGAASLTAVNVATLAIILFGVTYVVALR